MAVALCCRVSFSPKLNFGAFSSSLNVILLGKLVVHTVICVTFTGTTGQQCQFLIARYEPAAGLECSLAAISLHLYNDRDAFCLRFQRRKLRTRRIGQSCAATSLDFLPSCIVLSWEKAILPVPDPGGVSNLNVSTEAVGAKILTCASVGGCVCVCVCVYHGCMGCREEKNVLASITLCM